MTTTMNKVFIDCGANRGQSLKLFNKHNQDFISYAFEPYKELMEKYLKENPNVIYFPSLVSTYNGYQEFYKSKSTRCPESSSVYATKGGNYKIGCQVPCIDFSDFLMTFNYPDSKYFVVVKMDIEGAEYPVLEHLIDTGNINIIDILYIEWHYNKVGIDKSVHDNLIVALKSTNVIVLPEMKLYYKNKTNIL